MTQPNQYEDEVKAILNTTQVADLPDALLTPEQIVTREQAKLVIDRLTREMMQLITQKQLEAEERIESKYNNIVSTFERQVSHGNGLDQWQIEELLAELTKQEGKS